MDYDQGRFIVNTKSPMVTEGQLAWLLSCREFWGEPQDGAYTVELMVTGLGGASQARGSIYSLLKHHLPENLSMRGIGVKVENTANFIHLITIRVPGPILSRLFHPTNSKRRGAVVAA